MDIKFTQTQTEWSVIAGVQLLHTISTGSVDIPSLLLQHVKNLIFSFLRKMTMTGEAYTASQDESQREKNRLDTKRSVDEFTRLQLQQTFQCFSEWMDKNYARSVQTVESIVMEVKERTSFLY